jgi:amino acid transporter
VLGPAVFNDDPLGSILQVVLVVSVLTSSAASTQTTILQTARAALSMGVHGALPARCTEIHPRYLTPSVATWATGTVAIVFYVGLTTVSENVLIDSIAAVALLISFYYGITGFACVWYFRGELTGRALWTKGVLPGAGGLMLLVAFVMSAVGFATPDSSQTTMFGLGGALVIGIGSLVLGAVVMVAYSRVAPAFFAGRTLPVRVGRGRPVRFRLPLSLPFPRPARPQPAAPPPHPAAPQADLFDPAGLTSPVGNVVQRPVEARDRPPDPGPRPAPSRPGQQRHRA